MAKEVKKKKRCLHEDSLLANDFRKFFEKKPRVEVRCEKCGRTRFITKLPKR